VWIHGAAKSVNLLLQHWTGKINQLGFLSMDANSAYAAECGADYQFLSGDVFGEGYCPFVQKMHILDECFDEYDVVVMTDMDMFPRKGLTESIFDATGHGVCDQHNRTHARARLFKLWPEYSSPSSPWWGGSIYRFDRHTRVALRAQFSQIDEEWELWNSKGSPVDEGLMHRCAMLAELPMKDAHLADGWSVGHFHPQVAQANYIHIRSGLREPSGKAIGALPKIDNYKELHRQGII